jgi:hypothetical protein
MDRVDTILVRFPGPVRLYISRLKRILMVVIGAPVAALLAWILYADIFADLGRPEVGTKVGIWFLMLLSGAIAVSGVVLLRRPGVGFMTLDADGFGTSHIFGAEKRTRWRDVSEFELRDRPGSVGTYDPVAMYDLPNAPSWPWRMLPDNYGLTEAEIVRLMNEWRARALSGS